MTGNSSLSKVQILIQQKKYAAAEGVLKDLLAQEPNNIHFMALLAEVNLQQDKYDIAKKLVDNAIGLSPDSPHLFYIKARIDAQQERFDDAENDIRQSIALDPYDADYFAWLAHIKLIRKQYEQALELANQALAIDSENLLGLNTRSTALLKLNKKEESFITIEGALRKDPNNAYTHANYGWGLLEKGDHKKAMEHFREALKKEPTYRYAQAGMMEALKARNPIYRLFLKYAFWIGNLTAKYQWGVIIGFYLGMRVLRLIAESNKAIQPYLEPLIMAMLLIAISTWVIKPISNLFLRFNRYGKFLLTRNEKISSNFVGGAFAIFVAGLLASFILKDDKYITIAILGFAMMVPFSVMLVPSKYNSLLIYAIVMAVTGIAGIALTFSGGEMFNTVAIIFALEFVAFQWVANFLMIRANNK